LTSYPGTGRKSALLGRVRTCQGACLVSSPTLAVRGHSTSPHPDPALALGWSVHQPGEVSGLQPPAPVLRGGSRIAAVSSPRRAQRTTSRRARHAPYAYIMNPKNLSPAFPPHGGRVVGRNKATAALRRSTSSDNGAIGLRLLRPTIHYRMKNASTRMPGSRGTEPSRSIRTSMTSTSVARRAPREPMRGRASEGAISATLPSNSRPG
jgi:hypothetical protein